MASGMPDKRSVHTYFSELGVEYRRGMVFDVRRIFYMQYITLILLRIRWLFSHFHYVDSMLNIEQCYNILF